MRKLLGRIFGSRFDRRYGSYRHEDVQEWKKMIQEMDFTIRNNYSSMQEQDRRIQELEKVVQERDLQIRNIGQAVEIRNGRINELEKYLRAVITVDSTVDGRRQRSSLLSTIAEDASTNRREDELVRELTSKDRKIDELQSAYRSALRDRELASALAGKPLVGGAASQLIKLWRDDFDVYEEAGEYKVAARDGRTTTQWIADRLSGPEYAHFCLPTSRGGVGAKGLSRSSESDGTTSGPRTLGEAVVSQWRESAASRGSTPQGPAGWGHRR